jgi:hypothetical protein
MLYLKQSTAATVVLGPFVDDSDGKTAETGLTIAQADIRLSKNGAAFAQTNNASGATHMESGFYSVPLDTTDTGTLGRLTVAVSESGALPVYREFQVVTANVWDTLCSTEHFDVNVVEVSGDSTAADNLESACDGTGYNLGGGDVVAASVTAGVSLADDAITSAKFDETTAFPLASADTGATEVARTGADSDTLETLSDQIDSCYTGTPPTANAIADQVWEEAIADHSGTAGSTAEQLAAAGAGGDPWATAVPGAYGAGTAGKILGDNLNAAVGDIPTNPILDTEDGSSFTAVPWNASWDAEVQSECADAITAAGVSTHDAAAVKTAMEAGGSHLALIKAVTDALTTAAATKLATSAGTMVTGTVSHDNTAASTTVFYSDDITEATADHYNGRIVIFTSGDLQYQATDITDYELAAGEGKFTVTALTEAPADNVTFIIV